MKYYFFLDETGDHGLSYIDRNFPLFLLCGCLFSEDALTIIEKNINAFKTSLFASTEVILHSREIRKCEGPFQVLFDLKIKERFYRELNTILGKADFKIIGAAIQKEAHVKKYGKHAGDPYELSLSFILERLIFCLNSTDKTAKVEIKAEERGKKEDNILIAQYNSISDRGTFFIKGYELKQKIESFKFYSKKDNILGLQVADLCAYPLARHILNPKEPYKPYDIIKDKIYCSDKGKIDGWGLKLFP